MSSSSDWSLTSLGVVFWLGLQLKGRERTALRVGDRLKEKFAHHPEVKRIARHRHVPKHVYNGRNELRSSQQSIKRKSVLFSSFFYRLC